MTNTVAVASSYVTIGTTGCPPYDWSSQKTPNTARYQYYSWKITWPPVISTSKIYVGIYGANGATNSNPIMGPIGLSVDGVPIYSNADANKLDAYINEGSSFDTVGGHPDIHYHEETANNVVITNTSGTSHSPLFGIMMDGVPIYGPYGDNGAVPTNLDACNGHTDSTYGFYHYHLPANRAFPYTLACLSGCVYNAQDSSYTVPSTCAKSSTQYDYSSFKWSSSFTKATVTTVSSARGGRVGRGSDVWVAYAATVASTLAALLL
ncbi:hypothetical protein HK105_205821 [Polyrhizophydium stewartii]|uniref:YHYH domain-containing protein n=1 Tax=Polyrhizophydium stewartii TaxID=2732419 RepID=A0ABR4N562_9FUNG|nr:hypothetical protein HK105_001472 [Polyrhizophydium stewartii]